MTKGAGLPEVVVISAAAAATKDPRGDSFIFRDQRGREERYPSVGRALPPRVGDVHPPRDPRDFHPAGVSEG